VSETAPTAVFLSYAREDTDAARRIADALRGFGVEVWFDQNELRGGDTWDQKIRGQIKTCALFMPIVSRQTEGRSEGYFRREWKIAMDRTQDMGSNRAFIVPVVIDDTKEAGADVPEEFMRVQWTRLAGGVPTPEFVAQTKRLLEPSRRTVGAIAGPAPAHASAPASAGPSKSPLLAVAAVAVIAIGAAVFFALRPVAKEKAPAAEPAKVAAETKSPAAPTATPVTPKAVADKSIAILPFTNMSEEKDSAFFADGVHEDILTNLALVNELKVVSRTTVTQYRDTKKSMKQIGEELGVAYILEGSVRRAGNKVRVTGQLINARTDEHVWAKSYDKDLTDIFAIQSALAQEIASALSAAISPQAQKFIESRPTENPVAYDAFLQGRAIRNTMRSGLPAPLKRTEGYFQAAVEQDPKFAAAWGELAVVHALHIFWELDTTPERMARGDAAIARAAQLAPDSPGVVAQIGTYAYYAHRDYAKATAQYERLAKLKPNDATVYSSLGLIQRRQGRWAESLVNSRRAAELDPGNVGYSRNLLASLESVRRWPEAQAEHRRLITLVDDKLTEEMRLAIRYQWASNSFKEMDAWVARLTAEQRNAPRVISMLRGIADRRGDYAEAIRLDRLQPYFDGDGTEHYLQALIAAVIYAAVGDADGARQRLGDFPDQVRARLVREPNNTRVRCDLGLMEALLGHNAEAVRLVREGAEMLPESRDAVDGVNFSLSALLRVHAWTGDKEAAFAELSHMLRVPNQSSCANSLRTNPWLVRLHDDPRWEKLLNDPKNNAPLF
jgi:TolB-like protein/Tfp pilus assembly protein PilF